MRIHDRAYQRFKRDRRESRWTYYKALRNLVASSIARGKKACFRFIAENNKNCPKMLLKEHNIHRKSRNVIPDHLSDPESLTSHFVRGVSGLTDASTDLVAYYNSHIADNVGVAWWTCL